MAFIGLGHRCVSGQPLPGCRPEQMVVQSTPDILTVKRRPGLRSAEVDQEIDNCVTEQT